MSATQYCHPHMERQGVQVEAVIVIGIENPEGFCKRCYHGAGLAWKVDLMGTSVPPQLTAIALSAARQEAHESSSLDVIVVDRNKRDRAKRIAVRRAVRTRKSNSMTATVSANRVVAVETIEPPEGD